LRRDIAVVPQKPNSIRFPIRVEEAVMMGRYGKVGLLRKPKPSDWEKAYEAMEAVGIRQFSKKLVYELSGGEQQKVALARALAQDPLILLLDEPTTYLDSTSRSEIMGILHSAHRKKGLTTLLVSHDTHLVEQYSDKIYLLEGGKSDVIRGKE
jgi:ABC-type Mn2+/Zn2+ transport system ATPase subunit